MRATHMIVAAVSAWMLLLGACETTATARMSAVPRTTPVPTQSRHVPTPPASGTGDPLVGSWRLVDSQPTHNLIPAGAQVAVAVHGTVAVTFTAAGDWTLHSSAPVSIIVTVTEADAISHSATTFGGTVAGSYRRLSGSRLSILPLMSPSSATAIVTINGQILTTVGPTELALPRGDAVVTFAGAQMTIAAESVTSGYVRI